jgi:hypothetical protein
MSNYKQLPDGRWQKHIVPEEALPQYVTAHYMRDNHTFLSLPLDIEDALQLLRNERDAGWTYGMLCGRPTGVVPEPIHARGLEYWDSFERAARYWLTAAIAKSKPPKEQKP